MSAVMVMMVVVMMVYCDGMRSVVCVMLVMMVMVNVFYVLVDWYYEVMVVVEYVCFCVKRVEYFWFVVN